MTFSERYRSLLSFKSRDVEEPIDMYWHRPLAALFTATVVATPLPLSPNRITLGSLVCGWSAAAVLWSVAIAETLPGWGWALAALLYLASVILDCADGQYARFKGGGTRMGRIIDGLVDVMVVVPFYVILAIWATNQHGWAGFGFIAFAGINQWAQIASYDRFKALYLARTQPGNADGGESREDVEADYQRAMREGTTFEKVGFFIYVKMLLAAQDKMAGDAPVPEPVEDLEAYRSDHAGTMRVASFLGLGTHMIVIYGSVALMWVWPWAIYAGQALFITIFNLVFFYSLVRTRRF